MYPSVQNNGTLRVNKVQIMVHVAWTKVVSDHFTQTLSPTFKPERAFVKLKTDLVSI